MNETLQELLHHIKNKAYINTLNVTIVGEGEFNDYFTFDELDCYAHYTVNSWELDLAEETLTLEIEGR